MRRHYMLLLLTFLGTAIAQKQNEGYNETKDTIIAWYPIPIKLNTIQRSLNDAKQPGLFFTDLAYPSKMENFQKAGEERQANVPNKTKDEEEYLGRSAKLSDPLENVSDKLVQPLPTNETSTHNKTNNFLSHENDTHNEQIDYTNSDKVIDEYSTIDGFPHKAHSDDSENISAIYSNMLSKNIKNRSTDRKDSLQPSNNDLITNRNINLEHSYTNGSDNQYQKKENPSKTLTLKISIIHGDPKSPLGQSSNESYKDSDDKFPIFYNNFSIPLVDVATDTSKDNATLHKGNELLENTEPIPILTNATIDSNNTMQVRVLEDTISNNTEVQIPALDRKVDESAIQNKTDAISNYTLDDHPKHYKDNLSNIIEKILKVDSQEISSEELDDDWEMKSFQKQLPNKSKNSAINNNTKTNKQIQEITDTNQKEDEVPEPTERYTGVSEINAEKSQTIKTEIEKIHTTEPFERKAQTIKANEGKPQNTQSNEKKTQTAEQNGEKTQITRINEEKPQTAKINDEGTGKVSLEGGNKTFKPIPSKISLTEADIGTPNTLRGEIVQKEPLIARNMNNVNVNNCSHVNSSLLSLCESSDITDGVATNDGTSSNNDLSVLVKQYLLNLNKNTGNLQTKFGNTELDEPVPQNRRSKCMYNLLEALLRGLQMEA